MRSIRILGSVFLLSVFVFFASGSAMPKDKVDQEIEGIQKTIEENGYHWTAGRTSVMELAPEDRQKLLGLKVPEWYDQWFRNAKKLQVSPSVQRYFPPVFDWRDSSGVTPVKNQGGAEAAGLLAL
ncbi:MAG: hypothetical protein WCE90_06565 [Candidatus Zixiibacteriota bacterium]